MVLHSSCIKQVVVQPLMTLVNKANVLSFSLGNVLFMGLRTAYALGVP